MSVVMRGRPATGPSPDRSPSACARSGTAMARAGSTGSRWPAPTRRTTSTAPGRPSWYRTTNGRKEFEHVLAVLRRIDASFDGVHRFVCERAEPLHLRRRQTAGRPIWNGPEHGDNVPELVREGGAI